MTTNAAGPQTHTSRRACSPRIVWPFSLIRSRSRKAIHMPGAMIAAKVHVWSVAEGSGDETSGGTDSAVVKLHGRNATPLRLANLGASGAEH